jgi:transcription elongation factor B subunit 1
MAAVMGTSASQVPSKYITLVSADGFEFVVLRQAALVSPIIKGMLDVRSKSAFQHG